MIERVFAASKDAALLAWVLQIVVREGVIGGSSRAYKNEVRPLVPHRSTRSPDARNSQILQLLIKLFSSLPEPDYFSICQCFVYLNDPALASHLLATLLSLSAPSTSTTTVTDENILTAYQIAFDLAETATQEFLEVVRATLKGVETAEAAPADSPRARVISILSGEESIKLYLEFLYRNNHADLLILKGTKVRWFTGPHFDLQRADPVPLGTGRSRVAQLDLPLGSDVYERVRERGHDV